MEESISPSTLTIRSLQDCPEHIIPALSAPSSPRSATLPSPTDSPSSGSVSSLPSVSSSFFFSSAAASPPHPQPQPEHLQTKDSTHSLVIPSLTLPAPVRKPTPYGQTLGDLRLLILGSKGSGKTFVSRLLLEDNEDVVEVGSQEETEFGHVTRASTDWVGRNDAYGLEIFEPTRNVEIFELPGYEHTTNMDEYIQTLKSMIQTPFHNLSEVLDPDHRPSSVLASLISSPFTPLYTALIFMLPSHTPTESDNLLLESLDAHIPIIILPRPSTAHKHLARAKLSSFNPPSHVSLRSGLFHSPETITSLRHEAADRFLRWREVERTVDEIHVSRRNEASHHPRDPGGQVWDKVKWEAEWASALSHDVAKRLRESTITQRDMRHTEGLHRQDPGLSPSCLSSSHYDPLHLPSLFMYSVSLFGPLRYRLRRSFSAFWDGLRDKRVHVALISGFCMGVSIGILLRYTGSII